MRAITEDPGAATRASSSRLFSW